MRAECQTPFPARSRAASRPAAPPPESSEPMPSGWWIAPVAVLSLAFWSGVAYSALS